MAPINAHRTVTRDDTAREILDRIKALIPWATVEVNYELGWRVEDLDSCPNDHLDSGWEIEICVLPNEDRGSIHASGSMATLVEVALPLVRGYADHYELEWATLTLSGWSLMLERGYEL